MAEVAGLRTSDPALTWANLRRSLSRARTGSSSRPETWTRLMLVDDGLPEPEIDYDIVDESGRFVACADLAYPERRVLIEYEGEGHRERAQFERDIDRYARLQALGWREVRLTARLVFHDRREVLRRVWETVGR
ncbi:endonuclease domain-containing protein [Microbacterium indicum]|uniref:endonuclease domain-containing protein n=1 Tax=Microbacterium indicum TaxID=358100 RepID=UPI000426824F|nr:DUF559 domain-containing protein [Microbacterium indicum]